MGVLDDKTARIMLDATPLGCSVWSVDGRPIDCNQAAVELFGLASREDFIARFYEMSPEYQPNGRRSDEMAREYVAAAFETGRLRFEWMHRNAAGEPIPAG